jgi:hypothetical protein
VSIGDILDADGGSPLFRSMHQASSALTGKNVYMTKCKELGVVPNSRIMDKLCMVRLRFASHFASAASLASTFLLATIHVAPHDVAVAGRRAKETV